MPINPTVPYEAQMDNYDMCVHLAPAASATENVGAQYTRVRVTTPASGTGVVNLPAPSLVPGRWISLEAVNTGGGEVKVTNGDGTTDAVGDNLSAVSDYALMYSTGYQWVAVKEVTT